MTAVAKHCPSVLILYLQLLLHPFGSPVLILVAQPDNYTALRLRTSTPPEIIYLQDIFLQRTQRAAFFILETKSM